MTARTREIAPDPAAYAARIKSFVTQELREIRRDPDPAGAAFVLVNELEQYSEQPVGDYKEIYAGLHQRAQKLHEHLREGGKIGGADALVTEMLALAEELPGEVEARDN